MLAMRARALAETFGFNINDIKHLSGSIFCVGDKEFKVCTKEEADQEMFDYVMEHVELFDSYFLSMQTGLSRETFDHLKKLTALNANEAIKAIINGTCGPEYFTKEVIKIEGRGRFLASYDGKEHTYSLGDATYYIYQID